MSAENPGPAGHDLIVVGASAGGIEALRTLVRDLPADLPAAVCVVVHLTPQAPSALPAILDRAGALPAANAADGESLQVGRIYVAAPDHHLLVEPGRLRVVRGPKENRTRPAVDPLFRTAALSYGPRVVGVVLSGALDDGTAGLLSIKQRGGLAVVQDPHDALYAGMPRSALEHVPVDYCLPVAGIAQLLARLARAPAPAAAAPAPPGLAVEAHIAEEGHGTMEDNALLGAPSVFSCPECHGTLWQIDDGGLTRFRCRVGHAFSVESMLAEQSVAVESALWAALRSLEESATLSRRLAHQAETRGHRLSAVRFTQQADEREQQAGVLRRLVLAGVAGTPAEA